MAGARLAGSNSEAPRTCTRRRAARRRRERTANSRSRTSGLQAGPSGLQVGRPDNSPDRPNNYAPEDPQATSDRLEATSDRPDTRRTVRIITIRRPLGTIFNRTVRTGSRTVRPQPGPSDLQAGRPTCTTACAQSSGCSPCIRVLVPLAYKYPTPTSFRVRLRLR